MIRLRPVHGMHDQHEILAVVGAATREPAGAAASAEVVVSEDSEEAARVAVARVGAGR